MLIDVFSEQIRQRYLDEDLTKHKHSLFHKATLKQMALFPNGSSLMAKLCGIAGARTEKGRAAFDKGKDLISELCGPSRGTDAARSQPAARRPRPRARPLFPPGPPQRVRSGGLG